MESLARHQSRCILSMGLPPTRGLSRPSSKAFRGRSAIFGNRLPHSALRLKTDHVRDVLVVSAASAGAGTVRIIIKGRKLEITDAIREYAEKKVSHALEHYAQSIKSAEVTLSVRGGDTGTKGVKSEEAAQSLYASIDLVCDKMKNKLQKVKEIAIDRGRWPGRGGPKGGEKLNEVEDSGPESIDIDVDVPEFVMPEIVRTKYFDLEEMTVEEAAETLERVGHDFYVFREIDSKKIQVVYKRKEYGYGVIIPKN